MRPDPDPPHLTPLAREYKRRMRFRLYGILGSFVVLLIILFFWPGRPEFEGTKLWSHYPSWANWSLRDEDTAVGHLLKTIETIPHHHIIVSDEFWLDGHSQIVTITLLSPLSKNELEKQFEAKLKEEGYEVLYHSFRGNMFYVDHGYGVSAFNPGEIKIGPYSVTMDQAGSMLGIGIYQ